MAELVGIATWNYGEGSLAERIERFVGLGYNAVSLAARDARAMGLGETPDVEEAILRHSLPVTIHTGFTPRGEPMDSEALLADFRLFAEWHSRTGALRSVNYDAAKAKAADGTMQFANEPMARILKEMLSISDGAGFTVGVEDWPRNPEQTLAVEGLRSYPHYGILIDLGHMNMRIRNDGVFGSFPVEAARAYLAAMELPVNELHVHNNDGKGDLHAPPTTGTADMTAVAELLKAKGVECISTIEIVPAWCGLTENEGWEAARAAVEFWRKAF